MTERVDRFPGNGPADRYIFWNNVVDAIPGWLHRPAAIHTMDLLECQDQYEVTGSFLEIGVYSGKFFSILARQACRSQTIAIGIDPYDLIDQQTVLQRIAPAISGDGSNIVLHKGQSCAFDGPRLLAMLGSYARFVSIDGSHEKPDVYNDLVLAEQVLGTGGIVAVDDFLNYMTPGVNEAAFAYFATPRRIVPFAFIKNKLFLTLRDTAPRYRAMLEDKFMRDDVEEHSHFFRDRLQQNRLLAEARMWDSPVLLVP